MNELKPILDEALGREVPDKTWRRLKTKLTHQGITYEQMPLAFKILGMINQEKQHIKHEKLRVLSYNFVKTYQEFLTKSERLEFREIECMTFINSLIPWNSELSLDVRRLYIDDANLYRWFKACGLAYKIGEKYPIEKLIPVALIVFQWFKNQKSQSRGI